ncbi:MAG: peptidoglycan-associated lipoprotein Pal [Gammaproteobacteria bacterium]|nr:peptidoglycan-associated lipoprotein Pal [Gammaproteobacteria bacterium]
MLKHKLLLSMLFAALLGLGGCATDTATKGDGEGDGTTTGAGKFSPERMKQLLAKRTVYFEFDSSTLVGENLEVVQAHGQHLAANAKTKVTFEGHADERGTREYNLALGERRAQSVERVMRALGVGSDRAKVVSFGEEKPVANGHDESAWRLNRRVEIMY